VADYPFTTREAAPGMMAFEDIHFQLIDLPPLAREHVEPWVFDLIRRADLCWVVVDEAGSLDGLDLTREILQPKRIGLVPAGAPAPGSRGPGWLHKPALVVVSGMDRAGASGDLEALEELLEDPWPLLPVSGTTGRGLAELGRRTFQALGILRVYTKQPGRPADRERPFTLDLGATVGDLARLIHKDVREKFRFARIWGPSAFDGQTVQLDHVLQEGDVVEIHI
jgi:ribosome-interacting GTPase 1